MIDTGLAGKSILVTGANHGIGAATAVAFAREGARVFLSYLRLDQWSGTESGGSTARAVPADASGEPGPQRYSKVLSRGADKVVETIRGFGGRCEAWEADLADPANIPILMDRVEAAFGQVDVLVNNAAHDRPDTFLPEADIPGRGLFGGDYPLITISAESHDEHFAVNSRAVALLMAEFARRLVKRGGAWGRIINISTDGAAGHGWNVSYGASKSAGESYTRAAAAELGPYGITVNAVSPGAVQTGWLRRDEAESLAKGYPLRRIGTPQDIAGAVVFLASRQADWITGQVLHVGGGNRMV